MVAKYLTDAMSAVNNDNFEKAEDLVLEAKRLAPAFHEVHRVEAFLRVAHRVSGRYAVRSEISKRSTRNPPCAVRPSPDCPPSFVESTFGSRTDLGPVQWAGANTPERPESGVMACRHCLGFHTDEGSEGLPSQPSQRDDLCFFSSLKTLLT